MFVFIVFIVSIWSDLLCFVDDLCQILGMFSLNSIGCVTKSGPAGILEGNTTGQMHVCQRAQIFIQKDLKSIFHPQGGRKWENSDKMNKEQSADDPSVDLIRKKYA